MVKKLNGFSCRFGVYLVSFFRCYTFLFFFISNLQLIYVDFFRVFKE